MIALLYGVSMFSYPSQSSIFFARLKVYRVSVHMLCVLLFNYGTSLSKKSILSQSLLSNASMMTLLKSLTPLIHLSDDNSEDRIPCWSIVYDKFPSPYIPSYPIRGFLSLRFRFGFLGRSLSLWAYLWGASLLWLCCWRFRSTLNLLEGLLRLQTFLQIAHIIFRPCGTDLYFYFDIL